MEYSKLEEKIGVKFNDINILEQAFTHRSFLNENREIKRGHNERLEFLGDAVLELVTTDFLYKKYEDKTEGELTALRSALVNTNSISDVASELGFNDYLFLSKGEAKDTGRARSYILANTFESVVGAIYLDQGYDEANNFIKAFLLPKIDEIVSKGLWVDAKSKLQEVVQEKFNITPVYETVSEHGPDHDKTFVVKVEYGKGSVIEGSGKSKQEAEQEAARNVLLEEKWI
jgi:ribonuclease-3